MLKKLSFLLAISVAVALPAFAGEAKGHGKGLETAPGQHKDPHGQDSKARFEKLCKDLHLTDAQIKKAKPIWEDTDRKMKALHGDKSLSGDQRNARRHAIHDEGMKKFRAIITADQQKKLDEMMKHAEAKSKEHGKGSDHKHKK